MRQHRTVASPRGPWRRVAPIVATGVGTAVGVGWVSGCSLVYDLSTKQCSTNADCDAMGGVFSGLECVNKLCQLPTLTGCQSNAECIDQEGDGVRPYACIGRACVALLSPDCPTILPQTNDLGLKNLRQDDNALILAGTGLIDDTAALDQRLKNYDLALSELNSTVGGLGVGGTRKVVMVGCKASYDSTDELDRMMTHVVDDLKVPGMVACLEADDLQRAFTFKADAANVFLMSPLDSDSALAVLPDRDLMWHIGPGADVIARAYAPLLTRALAHLGVTSGAKVATVLTPDYRFTSNLMPTIENTPAQYGLFFNGLSVADNRTAGNYRGTSIPADSAQSIASQVQDLITFRPNVIISASGPRFLSDLIPAIEAGWPDSEPAKPFYVLSPFNYNDQALQDLISADAPLAARIAGVNVAAAADPTAYDAYIGRWEIAFPEAREERGYENFYDAAYYLLYAAAAAGQNLQSGTNLVTGMNRLLRGPPTYSVGPGSAMSQAMAFLSVGSATIQLDGTMGPPDFRVDGTRESPGSVWCVDAAGVEHADILRYSPGPGNDPTQATLTPGVAANCLTGF